jgi:hypothetical protein
VPGLCRERCSGLCQLTPDERGRLPMRIEFKQEGGLAHIPGLSEPVSMDTAQMPDEQARELERLVEHARFFRSPATGRCTPSRRASAPLYAYGIARRAPPHRRTHRPGGRSCPPGSARLPARQSARVAHPALGAMFRAPRSLVCARRGLLRISLIISYQRNWIRGIGSWTAGSYDDIALSRAWHQARPPRFPGSP